MNRLRAVLLAHVLTTALAAPAAAQAPAFSPTQEEAIRAIVRDYLVRNPEILIEALQAYEERQKSDLAARQTATIRERRGELLHDPQTPAQGPANADVVVVEFFDYRCQYCKQVQGAVAQLARSDAKLRIVYKELPILGPDSVIASRAALAAHLQGGYHKFHHALMARRGSFDEPTVLAMAGEAGLDAARLKTDMARPEITAQIERNRALARDLGIRGTPAFVVGDAVVPGAVDAEALRGLVARARQR